MMLGKNLSDENIFNLNINGLDVTSDTNELYIAAKQLLVLAEQLFGPKVDGWNFSGVEFSDISRPHLGYFKDSDNVIICLTNRSKEYPLEILSQLSHESCHLLHPAFDFETRQFDKSNVLNEGLSTFFQVYIVSNNVDKEFVINILRERAENYYNAYLLVAELLTIDFGIIKKLRTVEPNINRIKPEHFRKMDVQVPEVLIESVLKEFID